MRSFILIFIFSLFNQLALGQDNLDSSRGAYRYRYQGADDLVQAGQADGESVTLDRFEWKELSLDPDGKKKKEMKNKRVANPYLDQRFSFEKKKAHREINKKLLEKNKKYLLRYDSFFDASEDYTRFYGRVTDRDASSNIIKIESENKNVKFFRAGDKVEFTVPSVRKAKCVGYVRTVEKKHFVMYVKDIYPCWRKDDYFRRGTQLNMFSESLSDRIHAAAEYRTVLLLRKRDFYRQLNSANHFVWSYQQKKVQVGTDFDRKINALERQKQKAMNFLVVKNKDQIRLQRELTNRLNKIDRELDHFKIEKIEKLIDRWDHDQDFGLPVADRPQEMKSKSEYKTSERLKDDNKFQKN